MTIQIGLSRAMKMQPVYRLDLQEVVASTDTQDDEDTWSIVKIQPVVQESIKPLPPGVSLCPVAEVLPPPPPAKPAHSKRDKKRPIKMGPPRPS